jgi:hypothetical protein
MSVSEMVSLAPFIAFVVGWVFLQRGQTGLGAVLASVGIAAAIAMKPVLAPFIALVAGCILLSRGQTILGATLAAAGLAAAIAVAALGNVRLLLFVVGGAAIFGSIAADRREHQLLALAGISVGLFALGIGALYA